MSRTPRNAWKARRIARGVVPDCAAPRLGRPFAHYICSIELVIVVLLLFVPTAVPTFWTLPIWTLVQCPPVFPVIVVSAIVSVPPAAVIQLLLVKNKPPPNAFTPAAF